MQNRNFGKNIDSAWYVEAQCNWSVISTHENVSGNKTLDL